MNKKKRLSIIVLALILVLSSCVKRRFDSLMANREQKQKTYKQEIEDQQEIFPDDIIKLSFKDYKSWYKKLKKPPYLNLANPQEPKELSGEQRLEDFEYYFEQLKENYPFFGVLKREYGIDFIKSHKEYKEKIKACKTDKDFEQAMREINADLKNHHANIAEKPYVEKTLAYYSNYWKNPSIYYEFLLLNSQKVRNRYDLDGLQSKDRSLQIGPRQTKGEENQEKNNKDKNMTIEDLEDGLALIKIKEMVTGEKLEEDKKTLAEFLEKKDKYKKLIIDIRDNAGGSMTYWRDFLLPELLTEDKAIENYMFFKNGKKTKEILDLEKENVEAIKNINLDELDLASKEDLKDFSYYRKDPIEIKAKSDGFLGYIFLLTNERVYSAAEGLASFVKNTGSAIIVGTNTGGDGITLGLVNDVLPNSGLVFTYTNTLGYGPDGTINEEEKTKPDINASSYREAIEIIKNYK
ncbi:MAG: S41 family peptidase [Peptoniphilaceae bacterium]|nr:S41 family peptidase [Peptoniphilaceae bacterium]MDY6019342.1 S41 family peptidase [Anaerococcus sp.]